MAWSRISAIRLRSLHIVSGWDRQPAYYVPGSCKLAAQVPRRRTLLSVCVTPYADTGSAGGFCVGRMRSPAALRDTMRLMTCRKARALASMMSVLTARPVMVRPLYSASTWASPWASSPTVTLRMR